jgi:hypothetical protein
MIPFYDIGVGIARPRFAVAKEYNIEWRYIEPGKTAIGPMCEKPSSRKYIILAIGFTVSELSLSYIGSLIAAAKPRDRNATQMERFRGAHSFNSQEDDLPSCLYGNDSCSMEDIISQSLKANMASECTISEEIIAVFGAIPLSIIIYVSLYYDFFPRSTVKSLMFLLSQLGAPSHSILRR